MSVLCCIGKLSDDTCTVACDANTDDLVCVDMLIMSCLKYNRRQVNSRVERDMRFMLSRRIRGGFQTRQLVSAAGLL